MILRKVISSENVMEMIARVRAKLRTLTLPSRFDTAKSQDEKHTRTVCLLSTILLLPYFARYHHPVLLASVAVTYAILVLPIILHTMSNMEIKSHVLQFLDYIIISIQSFTAHFSYFLSPFLKFTDKMERSFIKMKNVCTMVNQIVFFMMCDRAFCPGKPLTSFYSLMFYNVIGYCISYVKQVITKQDWSPYVHISETTNVKHLAMTATNIVLELTKAVTFVITVVFMLLVFGLEQGLQHYNPSWSYIFVTGIYYMMTEKTFTEIFQNILTFFELELLESMEILWAPVILKATCLTVSFLLCFCSLVLGQYRILMIALYINIWLIYKDCKINSWTSLESERACLSKFRHATIEELKDLDDVCAVCLMPMRFARITPCHHVFHGDCLRLCLKQRPQCPLCKQEFT